MNDTRKQQILDIVAIYTNRYTAACFCENMADEERYTKEANTWMLAQKTANGITNEELEEALDVLEKKAEEEKQPFGYSNEILK